MSYCRILQLPKFATKASDVVDDVRIGRKNGVETTGDIVDAVAVGTSGREGVEAIGEVVDAWQINIQEP